MAKTASISEDARLKRKIRIALGVLIVIVIAFAAYYYKDRYVTPAGVADTPDPSEQLAKKVREHPNDADARLALAENYLFNRHYADAIDQAQQVVKAYPKKDRAFLILGVSYNLSQQPSKAVDPLSKFVATHEKSAGAALDTGLEAALYYIADSYLQMKRPADAIKPLEKALEINPTDADALYALGLACDRSGNHKQAISAFQKATMLVPDYAEAYQGMAASFRALGEADLAIYAKAMVSFARNDFAGARDALVRVVAKRKSYGPAQLGLGLVYEQLGGFKDSKAHLKLALQQDPGNIAVKQALGRVTAAMQQ